MKLKWPLAALSLIVIACNQPSETLSSKAEEEYLQKGDSITTIAQTVLLKNVSQAITQSGVTGAIDFCSEKAMPLTDSVSQAYHMVISRVTDKNRNPDNVIKTKEDSTAWKQLGALLKDTLQKKKQVLLSDSKGNVYYYKAITIAMPTCLKCHGSRENDIQPEVLEAIYHKYPDDKATGYQPGDFRGMWKVRMTAAKGSS